MRSFVPPPPGVAPPAGELRPPAREMPTAGPPSPPAPPAAPPVSAASKGGPEVIDLDLKLQLEGLQQRVHARRRSSFWLGNGALVAFLAGAACWLAYHLMTVYGYAALDPEITRTWLPVK